MYSLRLTESGAGALGGDTKGPKIIAAREARAVVTAERYNRAQQVSAAPVWRGG